MNNTVTEINTEIEFLNDVICFEHDYLKVKLNNIIEQLIPKQFECVLLRSFIRYNYDNNIDVSFEVGFNNAEQDCIEFGTNIWFNYEGSVGTLEISPDSCGKFTKNSKYRLKQIKLLSHVVNIVEGIEFAIKELINSDSANSYKTYQEEKFKLEVKLNEAQREQSNSDKDAISAELKEGDKLKYTTDVLPRNMLFNTVGNAWSVTKICDKIIKVTSVDGVTKQIKKDDIISLIYNNKIIKESAND